MNESMPQPIDPRNFLGSDSLDCVNIVDDQPSDLTVRPASPESLKRRVAERERLAKFGLNLDGTPIKPTNENENK